ncbi:MAG: hypothetical protein RLZZ251_582 [Actinomycetota bacterium]
MKENVRWSISLWMIAILFDLLVAITMWGVLDTIPTVVILAISIFITFIFSRLSALRVEVDGQYFKVGNAVIERKFLGAIQPLDSQEMARVRGRDADPAAFLAIRFWVKTGIRVEIRDPRDPTPYWLVSSRKYREFCAALKN